MNGQTCKLFPDILNDVQFKGNGGVETLLNLQRRQFLASDLHIYAYHQYVCFIHVSALRLRKQLMVLSEVVSKSALWFLIMCAT